MISPRIAVGPVYLFDVASSHAQWLSLRQASISSNVANANTPGYRAQDIEPFAKILDAKVVPVAVTNPRHITTGSITSERAQGMRKEDSWDVVHSGNSVSLEQEMLKAGDINRDYSLNTAIVKSFHRMFMTSAKS
uniref:Flagellar basal body rod protein n=1 Tax=Rhodopseudomonas palustris (strain BisA53) TaxID=316055 RepID=Q07SH7_RHOP5